MSRAKPGGTRRRSGVASPVTTEEVSIADEVREVAEHLRHSADLALIASRGEEPERGAHHIIATLADLRERLLLLEVVARRAVPAALLAELATLVSTLPSA